MRGYSVDLRQRIVDAVERQRLGKTAVAARFSVSRATVYRYLGLARKGDLSAKVPPGRPPRLDAQGCRKLLEQVEHYSDLTLEEHAMKLGEQGISLKKSSIANYFKRLGVKRKKRRFVPKSEAKKRVLSGVSEF